MISYKNWSKQNIFNKIARGLIKQGKRSKLLATMDEDGNRCALGMLIPKKYFPKKRTNLFGLDLIYQNVSVEHYLLLTSLQNLHDVDKVSPSYWPEKLRKIAIQHNLKIPDFLKEDK